MLLFVAQRRFSLALVHMVVPQRGSTHSGRSALYLVRGVSGGTNADGTGERNNRQSSSTKGKMSVSKLLLNTDKRRQIKKIGENSSGEATGQGKPSASTPTKKKASNGDRPFTLPPGQFKPKQSLGQNFLSDQNYVMKIIDAFEDDSDEGNRVVEVGPGPGALTRKLVDRYPRMTAIEIDQRAVAFLGEKLPQLKVVHQDVLTVDWPAMAAEKGGSINIIANLPYYIVSQVLFSFADSHRSISTAVVTMQLEVAERIVAKTRTKQYGIPSVVFQLYAQPKINFKIPPSVFFPRPKVDSALLTLDFTHPHPELKRVNGNRLRTVLLTAFQQRRKMLRASLRDLLKKDGVTLPDKWAEKRPEQLTPVEFIHLCVDLYGEAGAGDAADEERVIWRKLMVKPGQSM
jgi:16S rRNA (adenine1518-N6/adenine1519-N6)-dimethyltransferase